MQSPYEPPTGGADGRLIPARSELAQVSVVDSVRFVFEDDEWKTNVLIGTVLTLIPVIGPIVLAGWLCEIHQRLVRGHPRTAPKLDFSDLGHYLGRGVWPFLVQLVMSLPLSFIMGAGYLVVVLVSLAGFAATGANPFQGPRGR